MKTYTTRGCQSVRSGSIKEAAQIIAERMARKQFGKRGDCRTCTMGAYEQNGAFAEFSAFIGTTNGHVTTGRNVNFTVFAA